MSPEEYKGLLFSNKSDKYAILGYVKSEGDFNKIYKIYKTISGHPFVKSLVRPNVCKNLENLRRVRPLPLTDSLIGELSWETLVLEESASIISDFLKEKCNYEKHLLLGNYDEAETSLNKIEEKTGISIWLIENKFILRENRYGVESNWQYLSELSSIVKDPLILLFIENLSKRAESKISFFRFQNLFSNQLYEAGNLPIVDYLYFRLNIITKEYENNLPYIVLAESLSPIIDRYLHFKNVISFLYETKIVENVFIETILTRLTNKISFDMELWQGLSLINCTAVEKIPINNEVNSLINEYSKGNYQACITKAIELIKKNPTIIECYEVYVKSLIELGKSFNSTNISTEIDAMLSVLFDLYSNSETYSESMDYGLKIGLKYYSTTWAKQFLSVISSMVSITNGNKLFGREYVVNSQIRNLRSLYFIEYEKRSGGLEHYSQKAYGETFIITNAILEGQPSTIINLKNIDSTKQEIYSGRAMYKSGKPEEAIVHFEQLLLKNLSILSLEETIVNLFRCYIKLNLLKEACVLYVNHYLKNQQLVKRLNHVRLLEEIESSNEIEMSSIIEYPIFYHIASEDSYQQYVAYDTFLESKGVTRPTFISDENLVGDKFNYFLREVCTIEIMHHSYHFTGTDDLESERLQILNRLIVIDKINQQKYIKEITELTQSANIRKTIREVNKGRISVNIQQLTSHEDTNIKEAFNRFKEIEFYSKNKALLSVDTSNLLGELSNYNLEDISPKNIVYTSDPAFITFKVIVKELRDKFLFSKEYGLDGYLSTRIRHGTFINHIRSIFEAENIISQRNSDKQYDDNEYWSKSLKNQSADKISAVQKAIKSFSKKIDDYSEYIVKELIQIKTENRSQKRKALFDFTLSNNQLGYLFSVVRENVKDHEKFLNFIFEFLEAELQNILVNIRKLINNEIRNNYEKLLQEFQSELKSSTAVINITDLNNAINLCGTRLQNELKNISEWFYLSTTAKDALIDINVLAQTAIQITNTIHPNFQVIPTLENKSKHPLYAKIHLVYIFRILLDNIIEHARLLPNELVIEISFELDDSNESVKINFTNNISSSVDKFALEEKFKKIKNKWESPIIDFEKVDEEGDSGYEKIRRIIAFDLDACKYSFDYLMKNDQVRITLIINFSDFTDYGSTIENNIG